MLACNSSPLYDGISHSSFHALSDATFAAGLSFFIEPTHNDGFSNIMHQSKQLPLHIHIGFGLYGEVVQALLNAVLGEHRLDNGQTPGIDLFALRSPILAFIFSIKSGCRLSISTDKSLWVVFGWLKQFHLNGQLAQ